MTLISLFLNRNASNRAPFTPVKARIGGGGGPPPSSGRVSSKKKKKKDNRPPTGAERRRGPLIRASGEAGVVDAGVEDDRARRTAPPLCVSPGAG